MTIFGIIFIIFAFIMALEWAGRLLYFVKTGRRGGDIPFSYVPDAMRQIEGSKAKKTANGYVYHETYDPIELFMEDSAK